MTTAASALSPEDKKLLLAQIREEFTTPQTDNFKIWRAANDKSTLDATVSVDWKAINDRMAILRVEIPLIKKGNQTWKTHAPKFEVIDWGVKLLKKGAIAAALTSAASAFLLRSHPLLCLAGAICTLAAGVFARDLHQTEKATQFILKLVTKDEAELKLILIGDALQDRIQDLVNSTLFVGMYLKRQVIPEESADDATASQVIAASKLFFRFNSRAAMMYFAQNLYLLYAGSGFAPLTDKKLEPKERNETDRLRYRGAWLQLKAFSGLLTGAKNQATLLGLVALAGSFYASHTSRSYLAFTLRIGAAISGILFWDFRNLQKSTRLLSAKIETIQKEELVDATHYKDLSEVFANVRQSSYVTGTLFSARLFTVEKEIPHIGPLAIIERWTDPLESKLGYLPCWKKAAIYAENLDNQKKS